MREKTFKEQEKQILNLSRAISSYLSLLNSRTVQFEQVVYWG